MSEFLSGVMQWELEADGHAGKLPLFYHDVTTVNAIYTATTGRVRALLPHPARPIELYPGKCLVAITCFEYRKCDLEPYNEVSISFPITFDKPQIPAVTAALQLARRHFTTYVWQLPVTSEEARVGGLELYGSPKFLADITFDRQGSAIRCDLSEGDQPILSLRVKTLRTKRGKRTRFVSYTIKDGAVLLANVFQNPFELGQSRRGADAELTLGADHPIALTLRDIGLSHHPMLYQYVPTNEAILFGPRNLMDD